MSFAGTIVIVSFNSGQSLIDCLASIATHAPHAAVIVVDNASTDGSLDQEAVRSSQVSLHRNRENIGFGRAVNQGIRAATTELVLMLNPDCLLTADALEILADELARHPECALAGPRILDEDGSVQGSARGDPSLLTGLFGRTTLLSRLFPSSSLARHNVRTRSSSESYAVDWVSGACMLARRNSLLQLGGFDEQYFLYWEDADLCKRLRNRGQTVRYVPAAVIEHAGGVSSRTVRSMAIRAFHQSAYRYYSTHVATNPVTRAAAWLILTLRCQLKLRSSGHR